MVLEQQTLVKCSVVYKHTIVMMKKAMGQKRKAVGSRPKGNEADQGRGIGTGTGPGLGQEKGTEEDPGQDQEEGTEVDPGQDQEKGTEVGIEIGTETEGIGTETIGGTDTVGTMIEIGVGIEITTEIMIGTEIETGEGIEVGVAQEGKAVIMKVVGIAGIRMHLVNVEVDGMHRFFAELYTR